MILHLLIASLLLCYNGVTSYYYHEDNPELSWSNPGSPLDFPEWTQSSRSFPSQHCNYKTRLKALSYQRCPSDRDITIQLQPENHSSQTITIDLQLVFIDILSPQKVQVQTYIDSICCVDL
eukprot:814158_1